MTCIVVSCEREATHGGTERHPEPVYCELHYIYFHVILADSYYRNHEPPDIEGDAIALPLRLDA